MIGVRANCTFVGYEDSDFNGDQMTLPAQPYDRSLSVTTFVENVYGFQLAAFSLILMLSIASLFISHRGCYL